MVGEEFGGGFGLSDWRGWMLGLFGRGFERGMSWMVRRKACGGGGGGGGWR